MLYEEMKVPGAFKAIWWEQMKRHVRNNWMREDQIMVLQ